MGGGGGGYSYIRILLDEFIFSLINLNIMQKQNRRAKRAEYMNMHPLN